MELIMLGLRDYQQSSIDAVRAAWGRGLRRPAIVLPTGAGKTVVFAHLIRIMSELGVGRSVILVHRDELITQAAAKLAAVAPELVVGVWKGGQRPPAGWAVCVASVQSLRRPERRAELAAAGPRLVVVDECHHAVARTYVDALEALGCWSDDPMVGAYALGVTATMGRGDRVALGEVWDEVVYRQDILTMIRQGHLVNAKGIRVRVEGLDLSGVRRAAGDYQDAALAEAMHDALAPAAVARAYVEHAKDRQGILFAPTVELAHEFAEALTAEGVPAAGVDGAMATEARRSVLRGFSRGDVQVVTNCMVLTEGFDAPWCSAVVIARPTSSTPLYVQMAGRGLRPHPGKRDALIMDVVGVTGRHRLASLVDLAGAERERELPPELLELEAELDLLGLDELFTAADEGRPQWRAGSTDGPLVSEVVDLFGTRRQAWLQTARGVWFLSAGKRFVFLAPEPEPGQYAVARCESRGTGGEFLVRNVDLDMAMSHGEQFAAESADGSTVLMRRGERWRAGEPSQAQKDWATRARIDWRLLTKGEISDLMSVRFATRRIDNMSIVSTVSDRGYW